MTTKDLLKLSTRIFTARKGRTLLTVLGMGIGFGAILFLVSLGYGLQEALLETITSTGTLTALDVSPNEQEGKFLNSAAIEDIKKINGVGRVETSYRFNARIKLGDTASDARGEIASFYYFGNSGLKIAAGKTFNPLLQNSGEASKNSPKELLVSSAIGKVFGKDPQDMVGQKVSFSLLPSATAEVWTPRASIDAGDYIIAGVTENEEAVFFASANGLDIPADIPFAKAKIECNSSNIIASVKDAITRQGFTVSSLSETVAQVNKMFSVVNIMLGLFGIITLAVSAIGMFNTMTVALLERTTEIGIMRSIGASRSDILLMFIIESTLMGFAGGVAGIVLGVVSGQIVNLVVNIAAKYMGGNSLDLFSYPLWFLGFVLAFSIFIGFATGIGPAKRASSLDPLEALRSR